MLTIGAFVLLLGCVFGSYLVSGGSFLGATPMFAGQCNGDAIVDNAHYAKFAELLARLKLDVVFTEWPIDNHPDHRAISNLTLEAWNREVAPLHSTSMRSRMVRTCRHRRPLGGGPGIFPRRPLSGLQ